MRWHNPEGTSASGDSRFRHQTGRSRPCSASSAAPICMPAVSDRPPIAPPAIHPAGLAPFPGAETCGRQTVSDRHQGNRPAVRQARQKQDAPAIAPAMSVGTASAPGGNSRGEGHGSDNDQPEHRGDEALVGQPSPGGMPPAIGAQLRPTVRAARPNHNSGAPPPGQSGIAFSRSSQSHGRKSTISVVIIADNHSTCHPSYRAAPA